MRLRFIPAQDDHGKWGVLDTSERRGYLMPAVRYKHRDAAEAYADRLNAIVEGEPSAVVEDLRYDSDQVRG